jgi:branched-chain amino acid transport system permease protein
VLVLILFYVGYASSWNVLAYSGQVSFGHAAFLGLGGYFTTLIALKVGLLWIGILIGGVASALIGFFIGIVCVRLREWFLALVTFGFSIILEAITIELDWITAGTFGLAVPKLLPSIEAYYYLMFSLAIGCVVIMYVLQYSRVGMAFASIRENEEEAKVSGVNTTKYKLVAFTLSTFLTGILGAVYVHYIGFVNPQIFHLDFSFWPIIISVMGGLATLEGPIVGAILFQFIWEFLRIIDPLARLIVIGAIVVVIIITMPKGIVPTLKSILKRKHVPHVNAQ